MTTLLSDFFRFVVKPNTHPIYQRELAGWSYIGVWRRLRKGCVPLIALLFVLSIGCCGGACGLTVMPNLQLPQDWWVGFFVLLVGLIAGETILRFATGLVATALGATAISSEIEAQTFGLLRLTPIPVNEIVMAKFGAAVRQVRAPTFMIMLARLLILLVIVLGIITLILVSASTTSSGGGSTSPISPSDLPTLPSAAEIGATVVVYGIAIGALLVVGLLGILYYLLQPLLDMLMYVAIGVFASSWAKTRSNGLITAGAFRIGLYMFSYILGQVASSAFSLLMLPMMAIPVMPAWLQNIVASPVTVMLIMAGTGFISLMTGALIEFGISLGLISLTTARAQVLPNLG